MTSLSIPGQANLLLTGHVDGKVNVWSMDVGAHIGCIIHADTVAIQHIAVTSTAIACVYGTNKLIIMPL
jgi:hypothetical protein